MVLNVNTASCYLYNVAFLRLFGMNSRQEARRWFESRGLSISDWAAANGFRPRDVYAALSGRTRGRRGKAHEVAVALGLKETPSGTELMPGSLATK